MKQAAYSRRAILIAGLLLSACVGGSEPEERADFVLFFLAQSTDLDPAAADILTRAVAAANAAPRSTVTVAGYADRSVTPQANQILSRLRAQTVADTLAERGIARTRIHLQPRAAVGGDPGLESRRVEIRIGS
jgi:outer membrane protein OmpA-like peptidoglycan-associated protein